MGGSSVRLKMQDREHHRQTRSFAISRDKDEDLLLFRDIRKQDERTAHANTRSSLPLTAPDSAAPKHIHHLSVSGIPDDLFSNDCDKSDYDWLLTPPSTPPKSFLEGRELLEMDTELNALASTGRPEGKTWRTLSRHHPPSKAVCGDSRSSNQEKVSSIAAQRRSFFPSPVGLPRSVSSSNTSVSTTGSRSATQAQRLAPKPDGHKRHFSAAGLQRSLSVMQGSSRSSTSSSWKPSMPAQSSKLSPEIVRTAFVSNRSCRSSAPAPSAGLKLEHTAAPESGASGPRSHGSNKSSMRFHMLPNSLFSLKGRLSNESTVSRDKYLGKSGTVQDMCNNDAKKTEKTESNDDLSTQVKQQQRQRQQVAKLTPFQGIIKPRISSFSENAPKKPPNVALKCMDVQKSNSKGSLASFLSNCSSKLRNRTTGKALPSRRTTVSNSPMASCSISSSENSLGAVIHPECADFYDHGKDRKFAGGQVDDPLSSLSNEVRVTSWLSSEDFDCNIAAQFFEASIESSAGC